MDLDGMDLDEMLRSYGIDPTSIGRATPEEVESLMRLLFPVPPALPHTEALLDLVDCDDESGAPPRGGA